MFKSAPGLIMRPFAHQARPVGRCFSTTSLIWSSKFPPESPSYIRLPTPPQSEDKAWVRVRGHLPVPREVFKAKDASRKVQADYIQRTSPRPKEIPRGSSARRWKNQMAQTRRENLQRGLQGLWNRKTRNDSLRDDRVSRKLKSHEVAAVAPEGRDDIFTRSTVLSSLMDVSVSIDPDRFARADRSRSKVIAADEAKRESRRDALMELYISASNFIVEEQELRKEIDTIFAEDYFKKQSQATGRYGAENAWGIWGMPTSLNEMLDSTTGSGSNRLVQLDESEYDRSVKRQKRIAEEFTGGKME